MTSTSTTAVDQGVGATSAPPRSAPVAHLDELDVGAMRLVRVDGHRVCLVRTGDGVHAIDHACPHEGYGLTTGSLDGDVVTCEWHNWKFRVSDGRCLVGEEAVPVHDVDVDETGAVRVAVRRPDAAAVRAQLLESLRSAIAKDYRGQVARDVVRLLKASADPGELIWEAVAHGAPRAEFGWGHAIASATDCLAMIDLYEGDQRALPIVQGIVGIAENERHRPVNELPPPAPAGRATERRFRATVEADDVAGAQALVLAAIARGDDLDVLRRWFTGAVSDHHLSYGHGAIYSQKAFQLLDMIGADRAPTVLPHLVPTIVYGTREDRLPYMRPFVRAMAAVDLAPLAAVEPAAGWQDDGTLVAAMLGRDRTASLDAAVAALRAGAGLDGLLAVVVAAVSERMLRYDTAGERDFEDDFGWLDITHGLTYADAVRWHHRRATEGGQGVTPDLVRLALYTVFLAQWTGRHEWHAGVASRVDVEPRSADLVEYGAELQRESLLDGTTAFIVHAHAVKTSRAATNAAVATGSTLPLDATARFLAAPKLERFVAATVTRSIELLNGRAPRD
jgi:nitrite reductase/ring-hydroxylating ferredoxin subunit